MKENKEKLHILIEKINDAGTAEYLEAFVRLFLEKLGGADK